MQKLSIAENLHKWAIFWKVRIPISVNCKKKKKNEKQWNIYEASAKTYENKKYNFFSLKNQIEETEWTVCVSSYRNHAIN